MPKPFKKLKAYELIKELEKYKYKQFHIHHTAMPNKAMFNGKNHSQLQDNMRNHHMKNRGWSDIGQHITLFPDGDFLTGRSFSKDPASIYKHNKNAFMVEMLGNFDIGQERLEGKQRKAILILINYFIGKIGEENIIFHREYASTNCPGTSLNKKELIKESRKVENNNLKVKFLGKEVELEDFILIENKNYISIREIFEKAGLKVKWTEEEISIDL